MAMLNNQMVYTIRCFPKKSVDHQHIEALPEDLAGVLWGLRGPTWRNRTIKFREMFDVGEIVGNHSGFWMTLGKCMEISGILIMFNDV